MVSGSLLNHLFYKCEDGLYFIRNIHITRPDLYKQMGQISPKLVWLTMLDYWSFGSNITLSHWLTVSHWVTKWYIKQHRAQYQSERKQLRKRIHSEHIQRWTTAFHTAKLTYPKWQFNELRRICLSPCWMLQGKNTPVFVVLWTHYQDKGNAWLFP